MSFLTLAGWIFIILSVLAILFQLALVAGAPWGEYTMGGQVKGRLPWKRRFAALFQSLLLMYFAAVMAMKTGIVGLEVKYLGINLWIIVGFFVLGTIANTITPSKKERQIWAPVNVLLLLTSLYVTIT
jgi:hypothetical protein